MEQAYVEPESLPRGRDDLSPGTRLMDGAARWGTASPSYRPGRRSRGHDGFVAFSPERPSAPGTATQVSLLTNVAVS